ncbi:MAG: adenylate/guanylate cyclase domain-containing protein [Spirochaetales bacterium]|nr:adenylate/guanylate cyclase domain-containing protein [Spirochaetales bacterium]
MPEKRKSKLSAIMFTDITGYSRIMEDDEQKALHLLEIHNRIVFPLVERFDGRIVKTIGDALLIDFGSALSAANCAVNIQKALGDYNLHEERKGQIHIRIGIHIGDVWYTETDMFGDSVNVAFRLESFALPGGICISKEMHNLLVNKIDIKTTHLGQKSLKNSNKTIDVYRIYTGTEVDIADDREEKEMIENKFSTGNDLHTGLSEEDPAYIIKNKIFSSIEHFMDKALMEWNKAPQQKKDRVFHKFKDAEWFDDWEHRKSHSLHRWERKKRHKDEIAVGIAATLGFAIAIFLTKIWFLIFPLVFVGLIPLFTGISKSLKRKELTGQETGSKNNADSEKEILKIARALHGRVTVLQVASMTHLSIEDTRVTLDSMVKKGYIQLNVEESGILRYEFPDFFTETDMDDVSRQIDNLKK